MRERKLSPFDILLTEDSQIVPLTESRLRQVMFRPQMFDVTSKTPGDVSMIGQLYPPYRQNYGFGGGGAVANIGMGKTGSKKCRCTGDVCRCGCALGKKASVLQRILPTINETDYQKLAQELSDPAVKLAFAANPSTSRSLAILAEYQPLPMEKRAEAIVRSLAYDVAQASRNPDGTYRLKVAAHQMWLPLERCIDRGELVGLLGVKTALAVDQTGGVTVADGADVGGEIESSEASRPEPIKDFGLYRVETQDGRQLVGYVFPNLMDIDGTSLPLAVFTNGSEYCLQSDICGVKSGEGQAIPEGPPRGHGMLFRVLSNGKAEATVPIDIQATLEAGEGVQYMATSFAGDRVRLAPAPNVKSMTAVPGGAVLIPDDMQWLTLEGAKEVELIGNPADSGQKEAAALQLNGIEIRAGGTDSFSLSGQPLEKLGYDQTQNLSLDGAAFLLAGCGVQPQHAFKKLSEAIYAGRPITIKTGRTIKTAAERLDEATVTGQQLLDLMPQLKQPFLVKVAAVLPDTTAVDTVLSLGFLNPENIVEFLKALPILNDSQQIGRAHV